MALTVYNNKRNFKETSEPKGKASHEAKLRFVVQRHHASHIHYDFRLEMHGVLLSWAVPKGPSMNPKVKRLAMHVEDHPVSYIDFEGVIPKGNYGAGTVEVWDNGNYIPVNEAGEAITEKQAFAAYKKGNLKFELKGKRLKGGFALVNLRKDDGKSWLLIKHRDEAATDEDYNAEDFSKNKKKETATALKETTAATGIEKKTKPASKVVAKQTSAKSAVNIGTRKITNYIKPMLASVADAAFDSDEWIYELKLDGYRAIAELDKHDVKLYSRNGLSFKEKYPSIVAALQALEQRAVLDGEIVLLEKDGKPSFQKLQHYEDNTNYPLVYYVFDMLAYNGQDMQPLTLIERKEILQKLLGNNTTIQYCDHIETKGKAFYKKVTAANMEGVMAKKKSSTYHTGIRTKEWLKIKHIHTHEAVIAGYTQPRGSRPHFGALILGKYEGKTLTYIGHTGTGFTPQVLKEVWQMMQPLITKASPFTETIKVNAPVTWVKPTLVAELNYTEMTADRKMRHPVFIRLRPDKDAREITMNEEKQAPKKVVTKQKATTPVAASGEHNRVITINKRQVELTHLNKIYWPKQGYTKGDLIDYYNSMSAYILPYLKNRPLNLKRNPNGIVDEGFYHKDAGASAPDWMGKVEIHSESADKIIHYLMCNEKAALLYLVNLGCIEMNPWNAVATKLENPTYMVIDIDPSENNSFDEVIATALATKAVLDKAGADSYCKTSGASGLHVYVPMGNAYNYDTVKDFAHIIANLVQEKLPDFTTLERSLTKRGKNKIYIDYLQNRTGQTLAAAYSVRPKEGATVSTPLEWDEVIKGQLHPSNFTIKNVLERVKSKGDLFKPVLEKAINMRKCLQKLEQQ